MIQMENSSVMRAYKPSLGKIYFFVFLLSLVLTTESTFYRIIYLQRQRAKCKANSCALVKCPSQMRCGPNQKMKPNSGWCGCCPKCMTQLKEGDRCVNRPKLPCPRMPSSECGCGLKCVKNKCTK